MPLPVLQWEAQRVPSLGAQPVQWEAVPLAVKRTRRKKNASASGKIKNKTNDRLYLSTKAKAAAGYPGSCFCFYLLPRFPLPPLPAPLRFSFLADEDDAASKKSWAVSGNGWLSTTGIALPVRF